MAQNPKMEFHSMDEFPTFETYDECVQYYVDHIANELTNAYTNEFSNLRSAIDGQTEARRLRARGLTRAEKSDIISEYIVKVLRDAAPQYLGLWLMNKKFIEAALKEITKETYKPLLKAFERSKHVERCASAELALYKTCSNTFRDNLGGLLPGPFQTDELTLREDIRVLPEHIITLKTILERMSGKCYHDTARAQEQGGIDSTYAQKCADMDIILNFYLHMRAAGITTVEELKMVNSFLYNLGRKILGKEKIITHLQRIPKISTLIPYFNATGSIYMPPFALTPRRCYDWVAVLGMLKLGDIQTFAATPGCSPRYFTVLKLENSPSISCLVWLDLIETVAKNTIFESEYVLDQIVNFRKNPYQSTLNVQGNRYATRLVMAERQ
nr:MAG: nucleocapsid protein [Guiyang Tospo-like virus 1]